MFRSLWFRLTGTVVLVVAITMIVALVATLVIMRRDFIDFVNTAVTQLELSQVEVNRQIPELESLVPEIVIPQRDRLIPEIIQQRVPGVDWEQVLPSISVTVPQVVQNDAQAFLVTMRDTSLIALGVSGGLAILASTWLFWQITRPLSKVRSGAEAIAAGNLGTRVPVKSRDEVGRVAEAFNTMAGKLERQEHLRQQMVADVAHELRTPLSVMRGNLEAMIDDLIPASPEELEAVHTETLRLSRLVEDLRLLSLADAGELRLESEWVNVAALVETAVRRLAPSAQAKSVNLSGDTVQAPSTLWGDEGKLQQVLANLIGNAIRHTPAGGRVTVEARAGDGQVQLVVSDQGPGVKPEDLPYLFERLWKGDRSRARSGDGGSGLGLSIVRQLVELHGGRVEAALPRTGGLQVIITLPAGISKNNPGNSPIIT